MLWRDKAPFSEQRIGLELLWPHVRGKTVLDIGCAEGEIAKACVQHGAKFVHGVDIRPESIAAVETPGLFHVADVEVWEPDVMYDIVLMLGVLHKLSDPASALARMLAACDELAVIRLPMWPVLVDSRSGGVPIDLGAVAKSFGLTLDHVADGPKGQWVGYLSR